MDEFRKYLREQIKKKGYSIRHLSMKSGVAASHISRILNGVRNPTPDVLEKLAPHLSVRYEELMYKAGYLKEEPPEMSLEEVLREYELTWGDEKLTPKQKEKAIEILKLIFDEEKEEERD